MKHVMYAEKSLLMDDASAEALIDYAAAVADRGGGDTVALRAIGDDGNEVEVVFLLNSATVLIIESATGHLGVLENEDAVRAIRSKTEQIRNPPPARNAEPAGVTDFDFDEIV